MINSNLLRFHANLHACRRTVGLLLLAASFLACPAAFADGLTKIRVQLIWHHRAEFAGYYVAQTMGFYKKQGLQVQLIEGGPGISPLQRLEEGKADVAEAWISSALKARMHGIDVVNIAQIYRQSSMALACLKKAGIQNPDDIRGKKIGVWGNGDQLAIEALLPELGIDPDQVTLVPQSPHAGDLISGRVACATVMIYDEYWSLLQSGLLPSDVLLIPFKDHNVGFLENGLYILGDKLKDPATVAHLEGFLKATAAGWRYARNHRDDALAMVMMRMKNLDQAGQSHMLNTALDAIGTGPFGLLYLGDYDRSVDILSQDQPDRAAFRRRAAAGWTHRIWAGAGLEPENRQAITRATAYYLARIVGSPWYYLFILVGTVVFALAGFMRARQRRYDLFGAFALALTPAVGGGTLRDILIGGSRYPPYIFKDPIYLFLVVAVVIVATLVSRVLPENSARTKVFNWWMSVFDTLGLATFTVIGAEVALLAGLAWYWAAFCAALTCSGGGVLLDVLTGREPRTFQGEPYEEIAILGGLILFGGLLLANHFEHAPWIVTVAIGITFATVFILRSLVVHYHWRSYRVGMPRGPATG